MLQKMKIYSIIRSIKAEKNASNQQKGPASNIATVIAAISAAVAAALGKNRRFTTVDLASAKTYLILPL